MRSSISDNKTVGLDEEKRTAKELGMNLVPGSGCGYKNKGDLEYRDNTVCSQHKSIRKNVIYKRWLDACVEDALKMYRPPELILTNRKTRHRIFGVKELYVNFDVDDTFTLRGSKKIYNFNEIAEDRVVVMFFIEGGSNWVFFGPEHRELVMEVMRGRQK